MSSRRLTQSGTASKARFPRIASGRLKILLLGVGLLVALAALACSQGSYPVDIFYEMHYQQSYKSHEPPRLSAPASSVAWFPPPKSTAFDTGQHLFSVNCAMCHGDGAKGDGPVVQRLKEIYGYQPVIDPPDLTDNPPENIVLILSAKTRFFGPDSVMPPFGRLLSDAERLAIAEYVGTLSPTAPAPPAVAPPTDAPPSAVSPEEAVSGRLAISVNGDVLEFDKTDLEVAVGDEVVLTFNNASTANSHNWVVVQAGQKDVVAGRGIAAGLDNDWLEPGDPDVIASVALLSPGETGEVRFAAPPPGTYQFVCTFPGHNLAMFGDFVVKP